MKFTRKHNDNYMTKISVVNYSSTALNATVLNVSVSLAINMPGNKFSHALCLTSQSDMNSSQLLFH